MFSAGTGPKEAGLWPVLEGEAGEDEGLAPWELLPPSYAVPLKLNPTDTSYQTSRADSTYRSPQQKL